ncbi:hypothetical protein, partial [Escherichia coli]|uniref:hypothetical protein n=1 Tax=Escherichia coli TaxID=562 RepID=UPI001BC82C7E
WVGGALKEKQADGGCRGDSLERGNESTVYPPMGEMVSAVRSDVLMAGSALRLGCIPART